MLFREGAKALRTLGRGYHQQSQTQVEQFVRAATDRPDTLVDDHQVEQVGNQFAHGLSEVRMEWRGPNQSQPVCRTLLELAKHGLETAASRGRVLLVYQPNPHGRSLVPGPLSTRPIPPLSHPRRFLSSTPPGYHYTQSSTRKSEDSHSRSVLHAPEERSAGPQPAIGAKGPPTFLLDLCPPTPDC